VRSTSLLLALPLLFACGTVTDSEPVELSAGGQSDSPAGHASPHPTEGAGTNVASTAGVGGSQPARTTRDAGSAAVDAGGAPLDASTSPPQSAADGGAEEDAGVAHDPMCDGSDAMRLAYTSESGGLVAPAFGFTNPHGHAFIAIDGKCRYYVGRNYMHGVISGTLTSSDAAQLAADLHWADLDSWASWGIGKDAACPDSGIVSLMKANAGAGCSCGCDPPAPKGLSDALQKAHDWVEKLSSTGKPLDGAVSAVVLGSGFGATPNQPKFTWPLSRTIKSIPELVVDESEPKLWMDTGPWARFEDSSEFSKLRDMRTMTTSTDRAGSGSVATDVIVVEGGMEYHLFVRDELPSEVEQAWKTLRATVPST
jgi:hypothetical protein